VRKHRAKKFNLGEVKKAAKKRKKKESGNGKREDGCTNKTDQIKKKREK